MHFHIRQYSTLTLLLVILHIYVSEGQGSTCDMMSRPHPRGICGSLLSQAHSNLCFLLRIKFPHLFPSKRSTSAVSVLEKIHGAPLEVLTGVNFRESSSDVQLNRLESFVNAFTNPATIQRDITELSIVNSWDRLRRLGDLASAIISAHTNLRSRMRRETSQTSMVCDCCFNVCTPRHLATYC